MKERFLSTCLVLCLFVLVISPASIPAAEDVPYVRGDPNQTGDVTLGDVTTIIDLLVPGRPRPSVGCLKAADVDASGLIDLSDAIYVLHYLAQGGPRPPPPFPAPALDQQSNLIPCDSYVPRGPLGAQPYEVEVEGDVDLRPGESGDVIIRLTSPVPIAGFSLGATWDPAVVEIVNVRLADDFGAADLFVPRVEAHYFTVYMLVDLDGAGRLSFPAGTRQPILTATYRAGTSAYGTTWVQLSDNLPGSPGLLNRVVLETGEDYEPANVPGKIRVMPPPFIRGDSNSSGTTDISDGISIFAFLFLGDVTLSCKESADANNDGQIDISDGIYLLNWLFTGGPAPADPGPAGSLCGVDPDPAGSARDLGCEAYPACK